MDAGEGVEAGLEEYHFVDVDGGSVTEDLGKKGASSEQGAEF